MRLVLASASPRRADLLRAAGFAFDTLVTDIDESVVAGESPAAYVRRLAREKSAAALLRARAVPASPADSADSPVDTVVVLGADTAVVVDGEILGKPADDHDAASMLRRLSGRRHEVMTGVSLRTAAEEVDRVEITSVQFTRMTDADIAWYVASGEGRDKAGAYAIQGLASRFIPRIDGSYSNVVGLPVASVAELLKAISSTGRDR